MTPPLRLATYLLGFSLALASPVLAQAQDAPRRRRVAVLAFEGAQASRARAAVVAGLEGEVDLADVDRFARALEAAVGPTRPDRISAACSAVGVDAVVEGTMSRVRRAWAVEIVVRDCESGEKRIPGGRAVWTMRNLGGIGAIRGSVWARVGAAISSSEAGPARAPLCLFDEEEPSESSADYADWVRRRNAYLVRCQQEAAAAAAAANTPEEAVPAVSGRRGPGLEGDDEPAGGGPSEPTPARRPGPTLFSLSAGIAVVYRHLSVDLVGSDRPRTHTAPGYPELTVGAEIFPIAMVSRSTPLRGLGIFGQYRRHLHLQTTGPTGRGDTLEVETSAQELLVGATFRTALGRSASSPILQVSAGYGFFAFELDPVEMSRLEENVRMPTMFYENVVFSANLAIPLARRYLAVEAGGSVRYVVDVGQAARDLFGADTKDGYGLGAKLGLGGELVPGLWWSIAGEYFMFETAFSGRPNAPASAEKTFPSGTDQYVRGLFLATYRFR